MLTSACIATRTIRARLVIRETTSGTAIAWPMLVVDKCPWTPWESAGHAHIHYLCMPGDRWLKLAPCNRRPYMLTISQ